MLSCINAKSYSQQQHRYVANIAHGYNKNKDLNNKELFIAVLAFIYIILSSEHSWGNENAVLYLHKINFVPKTVSIIPECFKI